MFQEDPRWLGITALSLNIIHFLEVEGKSHPGTCRPEGGGRRSQKCRCTTNISMLTISPQQPVRQTLSNAQMLKIHS